MTIFDQLRRAARGADGEAASRAGPPPLPAHDGIRWVPASPARGPRRLGAKGPSARAVVLVCAISGGAWWLGAVPARFDPASHRQTASPTVKFDQIASAVRAPLQSMSRSAPEPSRLPALVAGDEIEAAAGDSVGLPARVENEDAMQPETVVVLKGLPAEARLSDGVMIGPGVWMLRADLLGRTELRLGETAAGQHELTMELRTPEGSLVSTARTRLAVSVPPRLDERHAPPASADAEAKQDMTAQGRRDAPHEAAAPDVDPAAARAAASPDGRKPPMPVRKPAPSRSRVVAPRRETVGRVTRAPKPARRVRSQVMVLSAPNPPRTVREPRLVWPGDDPRSAYYAANPPAFVGALTPNAPPASHRPSGGDGWHKKIFAPARGH